MTLSMADRSSKTNQIKVISLVGQDPEANRWQKAKQAESALRESLRNESKSKQVRQKGAMGKSYLEGNHPKLLLLVILMFLLIIPFFSFRRRGRLG
jgi:RNA polymerase-associated protein LEO1